MQPIIDFAHKLHAASDPVLRYFLWPQVESWLVAGEWEKLRFLLRRLPMEIIPDTPEFFFVRAHVFWGQNRLGEARNLFEKAHYFYRITRDDLNMAAASCIEIADIAHSRRQYQDATHYLQVAETLVAAAPTANPYVVARCDIIRAVVLHDLGKLQAAIDHAQAAYVQFEMLKDVPSQLFCLMAIATAAVRMGNLDLAAGQTAVALSLYTTDAIPALYYARILNAEVHIAWHRGDLAQAKIAADTLYQYSDLHDIPHQRLYATALQAHVLRGLGDYSGAAARYDAAAQLATAIHYDTYLTELAPHRAWLHVLSGETDAARKLLHDTADRMEIAQWMGANIVLAVAGLVDRAGSTSEELLTSALAFHVEIEATTVTCAIHCYLALAAFRNGRLDQGQSHGNAALRWLNEHNLTYFPHWWHPALLAEFAAYALQACAPYSHVLRRICVQHLGEAALAPLTRLLRSDDPALRLRSQQVLDAIQQSDFADLNFVKDPHIRAVLMQLIAEHMLRRDGLPLLFARLTTAERQHSPNATLVAVFGLYLAGLPREAIAERLGYSLQLVRNYVGEIYARFGLSQKEWPERRARFERLRALAQEAGYV